MTNTNDRYREKVRKLLALAESSNPHEAERALSQAKKIMAKYNISAQDSEIVEVKAKPVPRQKLKDYESLMVNCIMAVSGCEVFFSTRYEGKWKCYPLFVGVTSDASMAAYCFEVLYSQLVRYQNILKNEYGLNARKRDIASVTWVKAACRKLFDFFDRKEVPDHVADFYKRSSVDLDDAVVRETKKVENEGLNEALEAHGYKHGREARLNKATSHQKRASLA